MVSICGIDEAGRGPVIGPMVIAGVLVDESSKEKLKELGVKDSKLLSLKRREELFDKVKKVVMDYKIIVLNSKLIDDVLFSQDLNLNTLEAVKSSEIINILKPNKAILDCPSNNPVNYKNFVMNHLSDKFVNLVVEHKADLNYVEVGAASILAKVTRDGEINKLKAKYGVDFGSGYPSDPKTIKFLKKNYDKYDFFRKSWASWKKVAGVKKQRGLIEF
jgi:ribonuclease HII